MKTATPAGFVGSLQSLADGLLGSFQDRIELFSIEQQEEKFCLIRTFIWICAAVLTGGLAAAFASITLVYLFWESARLAVLGGLAALYAGALVAIVIAFRRHLARRPRPLAATLLEIEEDRACIRTGS